MSRLPLALILLIAAAPAAAQPFQPPVDPDVACELEYAADLFRDGDVAELLPLLQGILDRDGDPLDAAQTRAIALHEIGHLLGLDHTTDATNIMAPRVRVRDLSAADRATVQLLYSVPAGRVR